MTGSVGHGRGGGFMKKPADSILEAVGGHLTFLTSVVHSAGVREH